MMILFIFFFSDFTNVHQLCFGFRFGLHNRYDSYYEVCEFRRTGINAFMLELYVFIFIYWWFLDILGLDWLVVNKKMAPQWFLKLKIWCSLMSIFGLLSLSYVYMNFDEKIKDKKDIYKRFLEANQERLNIKIKTPS